MINIKTYSRKDDNMNELQIFKNDEFGDVRAVEIDGEPWMVGKDIANALGYNNPLKAIRDHVDTDDKGVNEMDTPGGKQKFVFINESGMYSLVFGSKLKSAKMFKKWVTSEVLPSIRKTGRYSKPLTALEQLKLQTLAIQEVDTKITEVKQDLENFKQDLPVLGADMDKITTAVRKKGISCLGGKESAGYKDNKLRGKVYSDIYSQLKRNFGVTSYKNIKRKQCERALEIINNYTLPDSIYYEIRNYKR